jgi:hypothetical protein
MTSTLSRGMKQVLLSIIAGLVVAGCCSTQKDLQRLSTSDLQLRRYELMYCLSTTHMSWDKQPVQSNAHDDVRADLEEKEAIEREITRRDVTNYHWPTSVTNPYAHDHCHCQDWVVPLKIW